MTMPTGEGCTAVMRNSGFAVLCPESYFQRFLDHKIRPDGRQFTELRHIQIRQGVLRFTLGSSIISAGRSRFVAGVGAEIGLPARYAPMSGRILVNVEFPKSCGVVESDNVAALSTQTAAAVTQVLSSPEVVDLSQLCIEEGNAVWVLYVNVVCIEYDGGSIDWALSAAVAALLDTQLPTVIWCPKEAWWRVCPENTSDTREEKQQWNGRALKFRAVPASVTVVRLLTKHWVIDPTAQEESLGCSLTIWRAGPHGQPHLIRPRSRHERTETSHDVASMIAAVSSQGGCLDLLEAALDNARQQGQCSVTDDECWVMSADTSTEDEESEHSDIDATSS